MRKFLIVSLVLFPGLIIHAQPKKVSKLSGKQNEINSQCIFKRKYSSQEILSNFPFNKTTEIKLISFERDQYDGEFGVIHRYNHYIDSFGHIKLDSIRFNTNGWKEIKELPKESYIELGNLMFNYTFRGKSDFDIKMLCYEPRNAVVFYERDKIIAAIDVCFTCRYLKTYPENFSTGDDCSTKIDLFKKFFIKNGIRYGTLKKTD